MNYTRLIISFFLLLPFFLAQVEASGTKTITRGAQNVVINWNVTGVSSCTPDTTYLGSGTTGDSARSTWLTAGAQSSGSRTFASVNGNPGASFPQSYIFNCTNGAASDFATLTINDCSGGTSWNGSTCAANQPDLTAGNIPQNSGTVGSSVTLQSTITNGGTATTGSGFTNLFQYALDVNGTGATDLGTGASGTILPSGTSVTSYTFNLTVAGTYYVRACADKSSAGNNGTITESDEGNNCSAWTAFTISPGTCPNGATNYPTCSAFSINASSGANGTVTPAGSSSVSYGGSRTYTVTPSSGYSIATMTIDGVSTTTAASYTFSGVIANHTISATFSATPCANGANNPPTCTAYSINASAGANGTVTPAGSSTVARGASKTYTITPNSGYIIATMTIDGVATTTAASYTFANVVASHTISATFSVAACANGANNPPTCTAYSINASSGANGTVTPAGSSTVARGGSKTYTITPNSGYSIATMTIDGLATTTAASYTFSNVVASHTISATFSATPCANGANNPPTCTAYSINASAGANGTVTPAGSSTVARGASKTYTITPSSGYSIATMTIDGVSTTTAASYTFSGVVASHTISATFSATPQPDLTAGVLAPSTANVGIATTLAARITNSGGASTGGNFPNFIQVATAANGGGTITDLASVSMSTLVASASATSSKSYTFASPGTYSARACADKTDRNGGGSITESNEANNCGAWTDITVGTPSVDNPTLTGQYSSPGSISFSCSNATQYAIYRDGAVVVATSTYTPPQVISQSVNIQGNYSMICISGTVTDNAVVYYSPTAPASSNIILNASPRTIEAGGKVTLNWSITSPSVVCSMKVTPICTGTCGSAENTAASNLESSLNSTTVTTDSNDPNGARATKTAIQTAISAGKALGKKTVQISYTADFSLGCGGTTATSTIRVMVSKNNEG